MTVPPVPRKLAAPLVIFYLCALPALAQTGYKKPPQPILDVLNAPLPPAVFVGPTREFVIIAQALRYPPLSELAQPMLRLAGLRVNPQNNGPHRAPYFVRFIVKRVESGEEKMLDLPLNAKLGVPIWSPDGRRFAFTNTTSDRIELWVVETATGRARRLEGVRINAVYGDPVQWMPDGRTLLVQLVPSERGPVPAPPVVPPEPTAMESAGRQAPARTFQDLLRSPHDERLFEYYATAQLAAVDAETGRTTPLGAPAIFELVDPSPDGKRILIARIQRPFSYLLPISYFPKEVEVWSSQGRMVYKLASLPLADAIPIEGVRTGPRDYKWRPDEPATLVWAEALDEGDPRRRVTHRDRILMLRAPFNAPPTEIFRTQHRYVGSQWLESGGLALISDYDRDRRFRRAFLVSADRPAEARVLWSLNVNDRYNDPGAPVTRALPTGHNAIIVHRGAIYLAGQGASPEGDRPFLDRVDLTSLKKERLFRSDAQSYESFVALLSDDGTRFITRRESPTDPPNFFVRRRDERGVQENLQPLTSFADPTPQLRAIRKQLVTYKRADGVQCSFTLYLPPDYKEGTRLPTVVWAYPLEYTDQTTASQITGSTQRWTTFVGASHLFFVLAGYAVLDNATMPVVGDPETVNNTFIEQIVMSAKAAIDKAVEMGVTDPERVGVGGHSYGAFMTANLLAHSDLFRAGIARSGAYNRTLTPFGFQNERRTLWEAPDLYVRVSPFMYAHKINEPLLLIHGEADNNPGTFPMQSERMYQAIRGTGGTVRFVMLPLESHGYEARESIEHALYEMISWFDRFVKNAPPRGAREKAAR